MTDTPALPTFTSRLAAEAAVASKFAEIAAILGAAKDDPALYPAGLPANIDRALRFSLTSASTLAPPEPATPEERVERLCAAVDAERDRRTALDFAYDFGSTQALNDAGEVIEAGVRHLQMRTADRANWQALQGAALTAVVSGQADTVMPMRAEDNWNIQTTAAQVLQVLGAMIEHGAALLFHGGALKSEIRSADDPASIDILAGWPGDEALADEGEPAPDEPADE